jgi:leucyl/phenylalanyl-tRNA--protein transferase
LEEKLVGGLYGVQIGKVFFGESMFSKKSNASKIALVALVSHLLKQEVQLIDCQMTTKHLLSFGAREISGTDFTQLLKKHI